MQYSDCYLNVSTFHVHFTYIYDLKHVEISLEMIKGIYINAFIKKVINVLENCVYLLFKNGKLES